jgi:hypothetical protein
MKYVHYIKFELDKVINGFLKKETDWIQFNIFLIDILWELKIFPEPRGVLLQDKIEWFSLTLSMHESVILNETLRLGLTIEVLDTSGISADDIEMNWLDILELKSNSILSANYFASCTTLNSSKYTDNDGFINIGLFIINHGPKTKAGHS